jgi:hypothetical protein
VQSPTLTFRDITRSAVPVTTILISGVFRREFVTSFAVSFPRVLVGIGGAATNVFLHRDRLQMVGIDTAANSAQVIKAHPSGNGAFMDFIGSAMGKHLFSLIT